MERRTIQQLIVPVSRQAKIKRSDYQADGAYPIVDQSKAFIAGYTDDPKWLYDGDLPVIVFGDHTRVLKWVDFPFCVGADGTQLIRPAEGVNVRWLYYALLGIELANYGYERHFKYLKESVVDVPDTDEQDRIAQFLGAYDDLIANFERRIRVVRRTRDLLLPRLLAGDLPVEGEK